MTVYVIQEAPGRNFLGARQFGDIEILLPMNAPSVLSMGPLVRDLKRKLKTFSDKDYLILMGNPAAIGAAVAIAADANLGRVKMLVWDRQECTYYPTQLDIHEKGEHRGQKGSEDLRTI